MRVGYSLALSEVVNARDLEYGDCAQFQITCPICRQAVFKGKRRNSVAETHYLSHYRADTPEAKECEARVSLLTRQTLATMGQEGRAQALRKFMTVFRNQIIEGQDKLGLMRGVDFRLSVEGLLGRPDFYRYEAALDHILRLGLPGVDAVASIDAEVGRSPIFSSQSKFWRNRQVSYMLDIAAHLRTQQASYNRAFLAAASIVVRHYAGAHLASVEAISSVPKEEQEASGRIIEGLATGQPIQVLRSYENAFNVRPAKRAEDDPSFVPPKTLHEARLFVRKAKAQRAALRIDIAKVNREIVQLSLAYSLFGAVIHLLASISFPALAISSTPANAGVAA